MKKKQGLGAIVAVFLLAFVTFGGIWLAWSRVNAAFIPPANQKKSVLLVIQNQETADQIAADLQSKGLISNTLAFTVWARITGLDTQLQAGAYDLTPGMTIDQITARLLDGQPESQPLLVIEGWRLEQIAAQANSLGLSNFNEKTFLNYTKKPNTFPDKAQYPFLKNLTSMEGLLFPNTYLIPVNDNTVQIIDIMLNEFAQVIQDNNLVALAKKSGLTEYQMVTLASIVQREVNNNSSMPLVSGIYWNRIKKPSSEIPGPYLQADPTVQYASDTDNHVSKYWTALPDKGDNVDPTSLWNTYTHQGWPPTPISSPGLTALQAAASPGKTDCYFFLSKPKDGSVVCSPTYAGFLALEQQYLGQ
jgi:UPF0755 protein